MKGPRRCLYCGHHCQGRTCRYCVDLGTGLHALGNRPARPPLDPHAYAERAPTMREELQQEVRAAVKAKLKAPIPAFRATCPNCQDVASPRAFACASCGTALYLPKSDLLYRPPPGART